MPLSTFTELKAAIADWANRTDLTTQIIDFITIAEKKSFRRLRIRDMEKTADITINSEKEAVPTRFLAAISFYLDRDPLIQLQYVSPQVLYAEFNDITTDTPQVFTLEEENFKFRPIPSGTDTGKLFYYEAPAALSDSNPSNNVLTNFPDIYLYGALTELFLFLKDNEKWTSYKTLWLDAVNAANFEDEDDRISGSRLTARATFTP